MDGIDSLFSNLKLNSDNSSNDDERDTCFKEIDDALNTNETTLKWISELGPISIADLDVVLIEICDR